MHFVSPTLEHGSNFGFSLSLQHVPSRQSSKNPDTLFPQNNAGIPVRHFPGQFCPDDVWQIPYWQKPPIQAVGLLHFPSLPQTIADLLAESHFLSPGQQSFTSGGWHLSFPDGQVHPASQFRPSHSPSIQMLNPVPDALHAVVIFTHGFTPASFFVPQHVPPWQSSKFPTILSKHKYADIPLRHSPGQFTPDKNPPGGWHLSFPDGQVHPLSQSRLSHLPLRQILNPVPDPLQTVVMLGFPSHVRSLKSPLVVTHRLPSQLSPLLQ